MDATRAEWIEYCDDQWLACYALTNELGDLEPETQSQVYSQASETLKAWLLAYSVADRLGLPSAISRSNLVLELFPLLLPLAKPVKISFAMFHIELPACPTLRETWQALAKQALEMSSLPTTDDLIDRVVDVLEHVMQDLKRVGDKHNLTEPELAQAVRLVFTDRRIVMDDYSLRRGFQQVYNKAKRAKAAKAAKTARGRDSSPSRKD